jgi:hypothetical protein
LDLAPFYGRLLRLFIHRGKTAMNSYSVACCLILLAVSGGVFGDEPMSLSVEPGTGGYGSPDPSGGSAIVLSNVPAYNWYHGCGPTAAASVIGYYDVHGFDNLFSASGWNDVKLTANVQDQISSPAHNAKYDPTPDDGTLPVPPNTSIACWFQTSMDPLDYGWSYQSRADNALQGYGTYRGYECNSWYEGYGAFTWQDLVGEINAGRPMMFLVDSDGNGGTDHFVPVLGYDDRGADGQWYGCYTTWSENETVAWYQFRGMSSSYTWGVGYGTYFQIVPEPSTVVLLVTGFLGLFALAARFRRR